MYITFIPSWKVWFHRRYFFNLNSIETVGKENQLLTFTIQIATCGVTLKDIELYLHFIYTTYISHSFALFFQFIPTVFGSTFLPSSWTGLLHLGLGCFQRCKSHWFYVFSYSINKFEKFINATDMDIIGFVIENVAIYVSKLLNKPSRSRLFNFFLRLSTVANSNLTEL